MSLNRLLAFFALSITAGACSIGDLPPPRNLDSSTGEAAPSITDVGDKADRLDTIASGGTDTPLGSGGAGGSDMRLGTGGTGGTDLGRGGDGGIDAPPGSGGVGGTDLGSGGVGGTDAPWSGGDAADTGSGGTTSTGGRAGTGGVTSAGGRTGSGGVTGTGGLTGSGGTTSTGGIATTGGVSGVGGTAATGGSGSGGTGTADAGLGGADGSTCTAEDDAALCAALGVSCGPASGQDNCGNVRSVSCGACGTCADPIVIPAVGGAFSGTTSGTGSRSSSCGGATGPEKVFAWTPDVSGLATVNTCGSSFDTVLDVATGACAASTSVACNDNSPDWCGVFNPATSSVAFNAVAGTTYYLTVDGSGTASGAFALTVASAQGSCAVPYEIPAAGGTGHYYMSGTNTDSASCGGSGYDRVHHWRPTVSGTAQVTVVADYWPATLYVRSVSCKGTEIACDNQTGQWPTNRVSFAVAAGTDYYVWVSHGSYTGQYVNQYTLTATAPTP